jgi:hypothetical protein
MVFQVTRNNALEYTATLLYTYMLKKNLKSSTTISVSRKFLNYEMVLEQSFIQFHSTVSFYTNNGISH